MLGVDIRFTLGRWHATPHGTHPNSAVPEWPPSPWRFMRALIATWFTTCHDQVPEAKMRELIALLARPVRFKLPIASTGHTRHYMPTGPETSMNPKKAKLLDAFVSVPKTQPVRMCWEGVNPTDEQHQLLSLLTNNMTYFGRRESWATVRVVDVPATETYNIAPSNMSTIRGGKTTRVLCPPRLPANAGAEGAAELFDSLCELTASTRKKGLLRPAESNWETYVLHNNALTAQLPAASVVRRTGNPTVVRFAVTNAVRPRITEALTIGEYVRHHALQRVTKHGGRMPILDGHAAEGYDISGHRHAHWLPVSEGAEARGAITHIYAYCPSGFQPDVLKVLSELCEYDTYLPRQLAPLSLAWCGTGHPTDFGGLRDGLTPLFGKSRVWQSHTPFIPVDHLHIRPRDRNNPDIMLQEITKTIRRELRWRDSWLHSGELTRVDLSKVMTASGSSLSPLLFQRIRMRQTAPPPGHGFACGLRLEFAEPVRGPIVLGYGSHWGLGEFVAN